MKKKIMLSVLTVCIVLIQVQIAFAGQINVNIPEQTDGMEAIAQFQAGNGTENRVVVMLYDSETQKFAFQISGKLMTAAELENTEFGSGTYTVDMDDKGVITMTGADGGSRKVYALTGLIASWRAEGYQSLSVSEPQDVQQGGTGASVWPMILIGAIVVFALAVIVVFLAARLRGTTVLGFFQEKDKSRKEPEAAAIRKEIAEKETAEKEENRKEETGEKHSGKSGENKAAEKNTENSGRGKEKARRRDRIAVEEQASENVQLSGITADELNLTADEILADITGMKDLKEKMHVFLDQAEDVAAGEDADKLLADAEKAIQENRKRKSGYGKIAASAEYQSSGEEIQEAMQALRKRVDRYEIAIEDLQKLYDSMKSRVNAQKENQQRYQSLIDAIAGEKQRAGRAYQEAEKTLAGARAQVEEFDVAGKQIRQMDSLLEKVRDADSRVRRAAAQAEEAESLDELADIKDTIQNAAAEAETAKNSIMSGAAEVKSLCDAAREELKKTEKQMEDLNQAYATGGESWKTGVSAYLQSSASFVKKLNAGIVTEGYAFERTESGMNIADYILLPNNQVVLNFYKYNTEYPMKRAILATVLHQAFSFEDENGASVSLQRNEEYLVMKIQKPAVVDASLHRIKKGRYVVRQV